MVFYVRSLITVKMQHFELLKYFLINSVGHKFLDLRNIHVMNINNNSVYFTKLRRTVSYPNKRKTRFTVAVHSCTVQ